MKKIVLNACGVKSLGGLKLFLESFDFFSKTDSKIFVLYSEIEFYKDLNNQFLYFASGISVIGKNRAFIQFEDNKWLKRLAQYKEN